MTGSMRVMILLIGALNGALLAGQAEARSGGRPPLQQALLVTPAIETCAADLKDLKARIGVFRAHVEATHEMRTTAQPREIVVARREAREADLERLFTAVRAYFNARADLRQDKPAACLTRIQRGRVALLGE